MRELNPRPLVPKTRIIPLDQFRILQRKVFFQVWNFVDFLVQLLKRLIFRVGGCKKKKRSEFSAFGV